MAVYWIVLYFTRFDLFVKLLISKFMPVTHFSILPDSWPMPWYQCRLLVRANDFKVIIIIITSTIFLTRTILGQSPIAGTNNSRRQTNQPIMRRALSYNCVPIRGTCLRRKYTHSSTQHRVAWLDRAISQYTHVTRVYLRVYVRILRATDLG